MKLAHESHVQLSVTELTTLPSGRQEVVFAELATAAQPSSKLAPATIHQERSDPGAPPQETCSRGQEGQDAEREWYAGG